jgi:Zn-dependent alcohol dehydrogenase
MKELMIIGSVLPKYTFPRALKVLEQGLLPMGTIVSHQLPLSRVHEGIQLVREGKAIKVVICPTDADVQS